MLFLIAGVKEVVDCEIVVGDPLVDQRLVRDYAALSDLYRLTLRKREKECVFIYDGLVSLYGS